MLWLIAVLRILRRSGDTRVKLSTWKPLLALTILKSPKMVADAFGVIEVVIAWRIAPRDSRISQHCRVCNYIDEIDEEASKREHYYLLY